MSAPPLFLSRYLGHPTVGAELGAEDEIAADLAAGWSPRQALARMRQRRQAAMASRCPGPAVIRPDEEDLAGLDLAGEADLVGEDLDVDELEISGLEVGDEEEVGADGNEAVGATTLRISEKIQKLQAKLIRLSEKLERTPSWKVKRRRKIQHLIDRTRRAIEAKQSKKDKKIAKLAAKMGISSAALAAAMASSDPNTAAKIAHADAMLARGQVNAAQGIMGFRSTTPDEGTELPIPFTANSIPFAEWQLTAGAAPRTVVVTMVSQPITYAGFRVKGVRFELQAQPGVTAAGLPPGDTLLNASLDSVVVNGGINLVYQPVSITNMFGMRGQPGTFWAVPNTHAGGLRDNPELVVNNTASMQVTIRNSVAIAAAINGTLSATMICERITDAMATRT